MAFRNQSSRVLLTSISFAPDPADLREKTVHFRNGNRNAVQPTMKNFLGKFVIVLVAIAIVSLPVIIQAQAISGDLLGVVTDSTGAVVSNAQVVATNLGTGVKSTTKTGATGEYRFINLPV